MVDIAHLPEGGKVFAALADGSIAVLQVKKAFISQFILLDTLPNSEWQKTARPQGYSYVLH